MYLLTPNHALSLSFLWLKANNDMSLEEWGSQNMEIWAAEPPYGGEPSAKNTLCELVHEQEINFNCNWSVITYFWLFCNGLMRTLQIYIYTFLNTFYILYALKLDKIWFLLNVVYNWVLSVKILGDNVDTVLIHLLKMEKKSQISFLKNSWSQWFKWLNI